MGHSEVGAGMVVPILQRNGPTTEGDPQDGNIELDGIKRTTLQACNGELVTPGEILLTYWQTRQEAGTFLVRQQRRRCSPLRRCLPLR